MRLYRLALILAALALVATCNDVPLPIIADGPPSNLDSRVGDGPAPGDGPRIDGPAPGDGPSPGDGPLSDGPQPDGPLADMATTDAAIDFTVDSGPGCTPEIFGDGIDQDCDGKDVLLLSTGTDDAVHVHSSRTILTQAAGAVVTWEEEGTGTARTVRARLVPSTVSTSINTPTVGVRTVGATVGPMRPSVGFRTNDYFITFHRKTSGVKDLQGRFINSAVNGTVDLAFTIDNAEQIDGAFPLFAPTMGYDAVYLWGDPGDSQERVFVTEVPGQAQSTVVEAFSAPASGQFKGLHAAVGSSNRYVAVWERPGTGQDIQGILYQPSTNTASTPLTVAGATWNQIRPRVAEGGQGYAVVYEHDTGSLHNQIRAQRLVVSGGDLVKQGAEITLATDQRGNKRNPKMVYCFGAYQVISQGEPLGGPYTIDRVIFNSSGTVLLPNATILDVGAPIASTSVACVNNKLFVTFVTAAPATHSVVQHSAVYGFFAP